MAYDPARIIARNLDHLMKDKKLSRRELATDLGTSRPALDAILAGRGNPQLETLQKLARYFGVSVWDLLSPDYAVKGATRFKLEVLKAKPLDENLLELTEQVAGLAASVRGIPTDLLESLRGLDPFVYDQIRLLVGPLKESHRTARKKSNGN